MSPAVLVHATRTLVLRCVWGESWLLHLCAVDQRAAHEWQSVRRNHRLPACRVAVNSINQLPRAVDQSGHRRTTGFQPVEWR